MSKTLKINARLKIRYLKRSWSKLCLLSLPVSLLIPDASVCGFGSVGRIVLVREEQDDCARYCCNEARPQQDNRCYSFSVVSIDYRTFQVSLLCVKMERRTGTDSPNFGFRLCFNNSVAMSAPMPFT